MLKLNSISVIKRLKDTCKGYNSEFIKYTLGSGVGLIAAIGSFHLFHTLTGMQVFWSNLVSDIIGISIVFILSWKKIFKHSKKYPVSKFIINLCVKLFVILLISWMLELVNETLLTGANDREFFLTLAKLAITPFTLIINYCITHVLLVRLLN